MPASTETQHARREHAGERDRRAGAPPVLRARNRDRAFEVRGVAEQRRHGVRRGCGSTSRRACWTARSSNASRTPGGAARARSTPAWPAGSTMRSSTRRALANRLRASTPGGQRRRRGRPRRRPRRGRVGVVRCASTSASQQRLMASARSQSGADRARDRAQVGDELVGGRPTPEPVAVVGAVDRAGPGSA